MTIHKLYKTFLFLILATSSFGQSRGWTKNEQKFYGTMKSLCEHFKGRTYDTTQRSFVFKEFVYFDNILGDTSNTQIERRIKCFDGLFYIMTHFIDSVGLENLDAKPTNCFKENKLFFKPYCKSGEMNQLLPYTLTYFDKRKPDEPIGTLLFEPKSHKLYAWIVVNQGGYHYFLTFNMV